MGNIKIFYNDRPAVGNFSKDSLLEFTTTYSIPSIIDDGNYSGIITITDLDGKDIGSYKFPIVFVQPTADSGAINQDTSASDKDKEEELKTVF